jgi:quinoprotein glucose dehydrogenase
MACRPSAMLSSCVRPSLPVKPPALVRQSLSEADLTNITPAAHEYALREFRKYTAGSIFTPPTLQGTLTQPGHLGGSEWHGGSFDRS